MVTSTISRTNLGLKFTAAFDKTKHLEEDKKWCEHEHIWEATNQVQWYLKRVCKISSKFLSVLTSTSRGITSLGRIPSAIPSTHYMRRILVVTLHSCSISAKMSSLLLAWVRIWRSHVRFIASLTFRMQVWKTFIANQRGRKWKEWTMNWWWFLRGRLWNLLSTLEGEDREARTPISNFNSSSGFLCTFFFLKFRLSC